MVTSDVTKYKNKIMNKICSTPDIITLVNNPDINLTNPDEMKNINVFSYMKIPNAALTVKNYICFDFNAKGSNKNNMYKNVTINMAVVCHENDIKVMGGNRHDMLGGILLELFNWTNDLGLELELVSDTESILEKEYHVRTLIFNNLALNSIKNGVKVNGVK